MSPSERKVFLETRIRNLERLYSKLVHHADLADEARGVKSEINDLKSELASLTMM